MIPKLLQKQNWVDEEMNDPKQDTCAVTDCIGGIKVNTTLLFFGIKSAD